MKRRTGPEARSGIDISDGIKLFRGSAVYSWKLLYVLHTAQITF